MDTNHPAAIFYYTNRSDVVCCEFCGVELGHWQEGNDPFKDHQLRNPSCRFIKSLFVRNILIDSTDQPTASPEQPTRSRDV